MTVLGEPGGVPVLKPQKGADPARGAFCTLNSSKTEILGVVLFNTPGRFHKQHGFLNEL